MITTGAKIYKLDTDLIVVDNTKLKSYLRDALKAVDKILVVINGKEV
ncbi:MULTISPECIES: hypothetical protein [unclassified Polaribacter]|nr:MULTISPECIES: hypothetical protein [unclassified Polaribacter]